jgi:hypothetical protein
VKTKIAPVLSELLREPVKGVPMLASYHGRAAVAELRALLSVARAAIAEDALDRETFPGIVPAPGSVLSRKRRALSRLARASNPRRRG